ncbi:MAG: heavy metal translocating P-type ATPase, partial [Pseudomonadota bacterium]
MAERKSFQIEVQDLSCASCVGRAEAALSAVPGVVSASVNLANGRALVEASGDVSAAQLGDALQSAGYPARLHRHVFAVEGLSCGGCAARLERALGNVPAVLEAQVNLANHRAEVTTLTADTAALGAAAQAAGYGLTLAGDPMAETPDDPSQDGAYRRAMIAGAMTLPVVVLEMGGHLFPAFHHWIHGTIGMTMSWGIQFILTTLVMLWPGREFFAKGYPALFAGRPDMNALVALGTSAAWGFSIVALFAPDLLPGGAVAVYFEATAVIITLILLGRALEARAKGRTGAAVRALIGLQPRAARVLRDGIPVDVPIEQIRPGDLVQIRPGERLPVDGTLVEGRSFVDESMLTGEPAPVDKSPGDDLTCGTVTGAGALVLRATAPFTVPQVRSSPGLL